MCRCICLLLLVLITNASQASGLYIRYLDATSSVPFEITYEDWQSPLEIVLQVANDSQTSVSVLGWQMDLELRGLVGSNGDLLFYDVAAPPDALFDQTSPPQSHPSIPPPSGNAFVQDVDANFFGEEVPQQSARNVLKLIVTAEPTTRGAFQVVIPYINDPETDSSWIDAHEFIPKAFTNTDSSDFPGMILLGTIHVDPSNPPGDYDLDGSVTTADYDWWRATFGTFVNMPGEGADGNRNGIVDAADYVIWRRTVSAVNRGTATLVSKYVPEPANLALASLASIAALFQRRIRSTVSIADAHVFEE